MPVPTLPADNTAAFSWFSVTASVPLVPSRIFVNRRSLPALPKETVLATLAIEPAPMATAFVAVTCVLAPSAVPKSPDTSLFAPIAVPPRALVSARPPTAVWLLPALTGEFGVLKVNPVPARAVEPMATVLLPTATALLPSALAALMPMFAGVTVPLNRAVAFCPSATPLSCAKALKPIAVEANVGNVVLGPIACAPRPMAIPPAWLTTVLVPSAVPSSAVISGIGANCGRVVLVRFGPSADNSDVVTGLTGEFGVLMVKPVPARAVVPMAIVFDPIATAFPPTAIAELMPILAGVTVPLKRAVAELPMATALSCATVLKPTATDAKIGLVVLGPLAVAFAPTATPPAWVTVASAPHSVPSVAPALALHSGVASAHAGLANAAITAAAEIDTLLMII